MQLRVYINCQMKLNAFYHAIKRTMAYDKNYTNNCSWLSSHYALPIMSLHNTTHRLIICFFFLSEIVLSYPAFVVSYQTMTYPCNAKPYWHSKNYIRSLLYHIWPSFYYSQPSFYHTQPFCYTLLSFSLAYKTKLHLIFRFLP